MSLCLCVLSWLSHVQLFATLWTVDYQAPLSTGFSRQEYWSGSPSSRRSSWPRIKPTSLMSPVLAGKFFTTSATWEAWEALTKRHFIKSFPRSSLLWAAYPFRLWPLSPELQNERCYHTWYSTVNTFKLRLSSLVFISCVTLAKFTSLSLSFCTCKMGGYYLAQCECILWLLMHISASNSMTGTQWVIKRALPQASSKHWLSFLLSNGLN